MEFLKDMNTGDWESLRTILGAAYCSPSPHSPPYLIAFLLNAGCAYEKDWSLLPSFVCVTESEA
jgi:hypothetical protein